MFRSSLEHRTVKELHDLCRRKGIRGYSSMSKEDLIDQIILSEPNCSSSSSITDSMSAPFGSITTLSEQPFYKAVSWKIPDFFFLPKSVDYAVQSPAFVFANATWCFLGHRNKHSSENSGGHISILIKRLWSTVSEHKISYKISFVPRRGTYHGLSISGNFCVTDYRRRKFLAESNRLTKQNLSAKGSSVTVICRMRHTEKADAKALCGTELFETADGSSLEDRTVKELHDLCRQKGIQGYSALTKEALIDHILLSEPSCSSSSSTGPSPLDRTIKQLYDRCQQEGIRGYSSSSKDDLNDHILLSKPSCLSSSSTGSSLEDRTVKELHDLCRQKGIRGYSALTKEALIDHILLSKPSCSSSSSTGLSELDRNLKRLYDCSREKGIRGCSIQSKDDLNDHILLSESSSESDSSSSSSSSSTETDTKSTPNSSYNCKVPSTQSSGGPLKGTFTKSASNSLDSNYAPSTRSSGGPLGAGTFTKSTSNSLDSNYPPSTRSSGGPLGAGTFTKSTSNSNYAPSTRSSGGPLGGDSKVLRDYKKLFLSKEDCDVTIRVKGIKFEAHRSILRARSSIFASMFRTDRKEVVVENCDPATFPDFLHYMYCGYVEKLSSDNVFSLYVTADKYDVQDLKSECLEYMKNNLSVDTFCDTITLSLKYSERELLKLAADLFAENMHKIIVTDKWKNFIVKNPTQSNELLIRALTSNKNNSA